MTGLLPAILRYTDIFESNRRASRQGRVDLSCSTSTVPLFTTTTYNNSNNSNSNNSNNNYSGACDAASKEKEKEKEAETDCILVACIKGGLGSRGGGGGGGGGEGEASKGPVNHAVVCLQELYEKSKQRPLPDSGMPLPPPPLLLQTLLWLLIRSEEGERDLVQLLLPHCEKFLGSSARLFQKDGGNYLKDSTDNQADSDRHSNTSSSSAPFVLDVDLNFLLRECYR